MTQPDPLAVQIGAREIYDRLGDVDRKVDRLVDQHSDLSKDVADMKADHEARIRSLERGRWPLPSLAVLVAIASLILAALGYMANGG